MKKFLLFLVLFCMHIYIPSVHAENLPAWNCETLEQASIQGGVSFLNSRTYTLGANDEISIYVYDSPEFTQEEVRIQPDGKITVAPLGTFSVAGYTIDEVKEIIASKLSYYLNDPKVTVKLEETRSFVVYVTGAIRNPGSYELVTNAEIARQLGSEKLEVQIDRKTPLLTNVLVAAGGVEFDADLENVTVTNDIENSTYNVNLIRLLDEQDSNQDIYLIPGDKVHVPKLPTPLAVDPEKYKNYAKATFSPRDIPVKVFGYVNRPGLVRLNTTDSITLNSAITAAGGYLSDSAYAPEEVFVSRPDTSGKLVTTSVDPMSNDMVLFPNDIVYVPEKARPLVGKMFDYMARVINPINGFANGYNNWALMFEPTRYQVVGK